MAKMCHKKWSNVHLARPGNYTIREEGKYLHGQKEKKKTWHITMRWKAASMHGCALKFAACNTENQAINRVLTLK